VKQYDKNTVLRMKMHFESRGGAPDAALAEILGMLGLGGANHLEDPRSIPLKVTYNLWYREPGNYMPRLADGRIGYFTTDHFSVDNYYRADSTEKYINRFHLEKADPQADLSEPVEPIVWYIDPSVPEEFRPAVREGILSWNEAYEEIGYQNAIVVKEVDPNNEDYDHADGMQNVVRWTMSESTAYAVALFRTDPFTGEILNASVTVDASYPALLKLQFNEEIEPTLDTARQAALDSLARSSMRTEHVHGPDCSHGEGWHAHKDELREKGWRLDACNHAEEFGREASMMTALLSALNAEVDEDKFIHDFVRETIAHEIGHCLGLRHNFAGSTYLEVDELGNPAITSEKGLSASVMDYNPPNVKAALEGSPVMFNDGPGVYDKWAIRYGYMDVIAASPEGERYALDPVAKQSGKPGHLFLTDEDADGINPLAVRWDSGGDSLNYLQSVLRSFDLIRDYAATDFTEQGEAYARRNQLILGTIVTGFRRAEMAARYIGGVEYRVHHKGDVGEQPTLKPVSARDQRLAMRLIVEEFLTKEKVDVPDSVLLSMNVEAESGLGATWNAPLRQLIGTQQTALLAQLMGADTADKILENEFKMVGIGEAYTLAEHYAMLLQAVYKEIGEDRSITPLRRDLQRFMLDAMIDVATLPNGFVSDDLRVVASQSLKRLQKRFRDQMVSGAELDAMTRLHLSDMDDRVTRFLNREVVADR
jgi:hypothetical protein